MGKAIICITIIIIIIIIIITMGRAIRCLRAHPLSLIGAFVVRKQNHWIIQHVWKDNKGPDDTFRMRRMILNCACSNAPIIVISSSKGLYETLRDIHISTYQICGSEENN